MRVWYIVAIVLVSGVASAAPLVSPVDTEASPLKLSVPEGWAVVLEPLDEGTFASATPDCLGYPDYKGPREDFQLVAKVTTSFKSARSWLKDQFPDDKQATKSGWTCVSTKREAACVGKVARIGLVMVWFGTVDRSLFARAGGLELVRAVAKSMRVTGKASDLKQWHRPVGKERAICRVE